MIKTTFTENDNGIITAFKVEGHAGYAPSGRDVVCAAVSALTISTVNGLNSLITGKFDINTESDAIEVRVLEPSSDGDLLIQVLRMSLIGIWKEYGDYMSILKIRE